MSFILLYVPLNSRPNKFKSPKQTTKTAVHCGAICVFKADKIIR